MQTRVFKILRVILWICAVFSILNIATTSYFFITKDPIPYNSSTPCPAEFRALTLDCTVIDEPIEIFEAKHTIYNISNVLLTISVIVTIIAATILILYSALHEHTLEHRDARRPNRAALIAAVITTVIAVILLMTYTNVILYI